MLFCILIVFSENEEKTTQHIKLKQPLCCQVLNVGGEEREPLTLFRPHKKVLTQTKKNSFAVLYFLTSQQSVDQITTRKQFVSQNHDSFGIKQSYLQTTTNRNDELH